MTRRAGAGWFLAVTVLAVGTEMWFAFDGEASTIPWTGYLIQLPWWALTPLVLGFTVWLPWHLWDAKRRAEQRVSPTAPTGIIVVMQPNQDQDTAARRAYERDTAGQPDARPFDQLDDTEKQSWRDRAATQGQQADR